MCSFFLILWFLKSLMCIQFSCFMYNMVYLNFFFDKVNVFLLILLMFIVALSYICSHKINTNNYHQWRAILILILVVLSVFFITCSILIFYVYFEFSILPIFLIILGGCDGCLNVNNPDNAGLETVVADLEAIYQAEGLNETISRFNKK